MSKELRLGYWTAIVVALEVAVFAVELAWYLIAPSAALNNVSYIACMLLAPSYVTMIACVPLVSPKGTRSFTRAALGLAAMYGVRVRRSVLPAALGAPVGHATLLPRTPWA